MDQQQQQPAGARPAEEPPAGQAGVNIEALTAAVERLLRRDLEIERERLGSTRR